MLKISSPMLGKARERISMVNTGKIRIFQGDFREIELPDRGYDVTFQYRVYVVDRE